MTFDQISTLLLEQISSIIILGLGIYYFIQKEKTKDAECKQEREDHKTELKELNDYIRSRDSENFDTLKNLQTILEDIEINQKLILSKFNNQ
jgi:ABC-type nickel/cobalt efflux system permease component RcnA